MSARDVTTQITPQACPGIGMHGSSLAIKLDGWQSPGILLALELAQTLTLDTNIKERVRL
jgi:hypothetical protein